MLAIAACPGAAEAEAGGADMEDGRVVARLAGLGRRTPPLARDLAAYAALLAVFVATAGLPSVELSLAVLPLATAIVALSVAFGRATAIFAALGLLVTLRLKAHLDIPVPLEPGEVLVACALGFAVAVATDRLRWHRRNAARAYDWADLAARQHVPDAPKTRRAPAPGDSFAQAFRSEGGV